MEMELRSIQAAYNANEERSKGLATTMQRIMTTTQKLRRTFQ